MNEIDRTGIAVPRTMQAQHRASQDLPGRPPTASDWELLRILAQRAGMPPERAGLVERRWHGTVERAGAPYTLLVGPPTALDLLLGRWLGVEVARAAEAAGRRPLILGPEPGSVRPVTAWPTLSSNTPGPGHVLALRLEEPVGSDIAVGLALLGFVEQAVFVTRLAQPLPQREVAVLHSLTSLAATLRLLAVALPGEEVIPDEVAELRAYADARAVAAGFGGGRCLGTSIWYTDTARDKVAVRPGTLADPGTLLIPAAEEEIRAGRQAALADALTQLLDELEAADNSPEERPVAAEDADRAIATFGRYLTGLGRQLDERAWAGDIRDSEEARRLFLDTLHGWTSGSSLAAGFLSYAEALRPGIKAGLLAEAERAAPSLGFAPPFPPSTPPYTKGAIPTRRLAVMGVAGLVSCLLSYLILGLFLREWLAALLSLVCAVAGARAAASHLDTESRSPPNQGEAAAARSPLRGWPLVEQRLSAWFGEKLRGSGPSVREESRAFRERWLGRPMV